MYGGNASSVNANSTSFNSPNSSCKDIDDCRTLSGMILSCFATLIAATWVSVHPNIPAPHIGYLKLGLHRLKLMLLAIITPEVIVVWALRQRMVAHRLATEHKIPMVHGFFISMGGFAIVKGEKLSPIASHHVGTDVAAVADLVSIRDYEIFDRSKGDEVTKGLAMLQTVWFLIQCIGRGIQGLPLSELEVVTIAFGVINLVIYIIWWNKPLDVRYPIQIGPPPPPPPYPRLSAYMRSVLEEGDSESIQWQKAISTWITYATEAIVEMFAGQIENEELPRGCDRVPTLWAGRLRPRARGIAALFALVTAVGFGGIHCIAWNLAFPTLVEGTLWRMASIIVMAVPMIFFLHVLWFINIKPPAWYEIVTFRLIIPVCSIAYTIARMFLIVLPFTSLRALPTDVYKDVSWAKFIPHIS
ncbi:hypothetical protein BDZ94DRAFT_1194551 [Collybia nuda]|uniref:Uncharacterized protein n=1 Tax=Collybia nuda TaxID=64659 RepID=A0A9P6CHL1_9AGAR|nr:hypothetical protein BDZ94DRAFT_1194551 [Collybia nuda]